MEGHDLWHLVVLGSTLMGAAGLAILVLAPLVFEEPPPGLRAVRPLVGGLIALAGLLLVVEWLGIH
ncbi:MAG: hypothetical protein ACRDLB_08965 [Actinomycetota bacterium]